MNNVKYMKNIVKFIIKYAPDTCNKGKEIRGKTGASDICVSFGLCTIQWSVIKEVERTKKTGQTAWGETAGMSKRDRKRARRLAKENRENEVRLQIVMAVVSAVLLIIVLGAGIFKVEEELKEERIEKEAEELQAREEELLSDSVLQYEDTVRHYAEEAGIGEHVPVLLAIMEVETKGERDDVMQSSESAGLEPNSLGPEESIEQACDYYAGLVRRAEEYEVDRNTIIQAYNYGPSYIYYIAENGGKHTFDLAVEYAEEMSGGRTADYTHPIADDNGNWMYLYGNMYYVKLVEQYLP